jgi:hypothetical protein
MGLQLPLSSHAVSPAIAHATTRMPANKALAFHQVHIYMCACAG